jgi:hypothetical protein
MDHLQQLEIECPFCGETQPVKLPGGMTMRLGTPRFVRHVARCFLG